MDLSTKKKKKKNQNGNPTDLLLSENAGSVALLQAGGELGHDAVLGPDHLDYLLVSYDTHALNTHTNIIRMERDRFTNTIGLGYDKITDGQKESEKLKKKET